jgi:hypothetical protein
VIPVEAMFVGAFGVALVAFGASSGGGHWGLLWVIVGGLCVAVAIGWGR